MTESSFRQLLLRLALIPILSLLGFLVFLPFLALILGSFKRNRGRSSEAAKDSNGRFAGRTGQTHLGAEQYPRVNSYKAYAPPRKAPRLYPL
jgi:hypothetical protein